MARQMAIRRKNSTESGFTLIELMVVMLIIGVLMAIAVPSYIGAIKAAKESVLKEDLHVIRNAIDSYTMDKQKAPQSLQDLVEAGYLKVIPVDPMTRTDLGDGAERFPAFDRPDRAGHRRRAFRRSGTGQ
jgi:prepilin-type N-terminal cleavage/methylation domain-containing protein